MPRTEYTNVEILRIADSLNISVSERANKLFNMKLTGNVSESFDLDKDRRLVVVVPFDEKGLGHTEYQVIDKKLFDASKLLQDNL